MPAARYFQGDSVHGPVKASAARTFKEVVETLRVAPVLGIGHAAFLALDKKQRNEIKQVPFFVPATFKESPSKRNYEHAIHCNLIFLDIDELPDGTCPAAPFVRNPALLSECLKGLNFAAHLTASSTPEKPRMRVIVDAEAIPLSEYPKAVATIGSMLGLPSITRESKVAVQAMFLPTLFQDSPEDFQPVIAFEFEGRTFTRNDIADSLDSYHGVNGRNGVNGLNHRPTEESDALEFLRAPVDEVSLAIAKEAITTIDPDCPRDKWVMCAAALRHQFSHDRDDDAYELFDEWSSKGSKYGGAEETKYTWNSVKPSPNGRLPVTIRSLLREAQASGWNDKRVRENLMSTTTRWFEQAESVMDLLDQGVKRILATPLCGAMQEDMLINQLCAQAKSRFAHKLTPTSVRKDLNRLKAEVRKQEEPPVNDKEIPPWAQNVVYVIAPDEFYRYTTGEKIKTPAFNAAYSRHLIPTKKQLDAMAIASGHATTDKEASTPTAKPSEYALNKLKIPTYQDYAYNPALPYEKMFLVNGSKLFNTYSPTYPMMDKTREAEAGELFQEHLANLIAEPENRRHVTDWMAFNVQCPGRKIRHAILIQSTEGAGKTFLAEVMKCVLGTEHVKILDGGSIKSGWNEWSCGKQVIVLEEVKVSGTSKYEIMNSLKPLITNDDISVNERFRNNRQVVNISNYIIFSNHHDALALTPGDRRYFVIKSPLQTKAQVLALGPDYFSKLFNFIRDHAGAMRSYLMNWEISEDFKPDGHAPMTKYMTEMTNDSASDLTATIRRLLLEGDYPMIQYDIVSTTAIKDVLREFEAMTKVTAQQIAQVLREEGMHQVGRHLIGEDRHYLWTRPGISEEAAVREILMRVKKNLKNLSMELLF